MGKITRIPTKNMSHEQWLAERRKGIGGSDAAAIVGLNKWSSPYTVYADKLGLVPPKEDNEAMRLGRFLESYIAQRFCEETNKRVKNCNYILINEDYPFALANVDRMVIGENAGLECKSTSELNLKRFRGGEYPENYYVQCVHYMAATGAERWYLAVLIGNKELKIFTIERDAQEITALMEAERMFWTDHVVAETPPPVDGTEPTSKTLKVIYRDSISNDGAPIELFGRNAVIEEYLECKRLSKEYETLADAKAQQLKADLGLYETGICDQYMVSWKNVSSNRFDPKRFILDHPELDLSAYYNHSQSRRFTIKEAK